MVPCKDGWTAMLLLGEFCHLGPAVSKKKLMAHGRENRDVALVDAAGNLCVAKHSP